MRAGKIFVTDLANLGLLEKVCTVPFIVHPQSAGVREWEIRTLYGHVAPHRHHDHVSQSCDSNQSANN
jgi:hypothetical protein